MELTLRSFYIYAAACGIASVLVIVLGVLSRLARRRRTATPGAAGHFAWAESEFEQIAAERSAAPRSDGSGFDEALMRAEMMSEARRIIAEVSGERRGGPRVEEALAHGLGVTSASGLRRRLSAHLQRLQPQESRTSRIRQLRHLVEAEEAPAPYRRPARLELHNG